MPEPQPIDLISGWLESEIELKPDCPVVDAIKSSTSDMVLNEGLLMRKLRKLCEPEVADEPDQED